ncbi:PQQ-binding-like beta-propeller repeat protein [Streptomyces sp. NPDC052107]|uniref:outer membrane protein assembly factor BamB family protein n=1 Tax=Streptomyces sp. NPDC052107 TaxID=3155632 RepID=UPI00343E6758
MRLSVPLRPAGRRRRRQGVLRTFAPSTGEPKWTCPAAEAAALLAADNDAVYFVTKDHRLRGVNRFDARIRWTAAVPMKFRGHLLAPAVAAQGRLVVSAVDGTVLVVHTSDGSTAWTHLDQDEDLTVSPTVYEDTVYINCKSLDARRLSDGTRIWNTRLDDYLTDRYKWGPATVYAVALYVNAGTGTHC